MATATDDNAANEKSDKSIWQLLNIRCTSYQRYRKYNCSAICTPLEQAAVTMCLLHTSTLHIVLLANNQYSEIKYLRY